MYIHNTNNNDNNNNNNVILCSTTLFYKLSWAWARVRMSQRTSFCRIPQARDSGL